MGGLGGNSRNQSACRVLLYLASRAYVVDHATRQPRFSHTECDCMNVAQQDIAIAEGQHRRRDLARYHLFRMVVKILVVGCAPCISNNHSDSKASASTASALRVVIGAGWNVSKYYCLQTANVNAHLQGRRTRE